MSNEDKESGLILNVKDEEDKLSSKMGQKEEKVERKIDKEAVEDKDGGGIPYKVKAGAFLAFAGGFGLLAGFGGALAQANTFDPSWADFELSWQVKKQDPGHYDLGSGKPVEGEEQTRCPFNSLFSKLNNYQHLGFWIGYLLVQEARSANG